MPYDTEAYVARGGGPPLMTLEPVRLLDVGANELLIEPVAVSICHTDIKAAEGTFRIKLPAIPGHEGSGYVKQVGANVTAFKPGDAVALSYASCSVCSLCLSGRNSYCEQLHELNFSGKRLDGSPAAFDQSGGPLNSLFFGQSSMSKLILAHESSAVKVDATREELKIMAPLGCGIQTGAGAILNVAKPRPGSSICIFGGGAVGVAALLAASLSSPTHLVLVDVQKQKFENSITNVATHKVDTSGLASGETSKKLMEITDGRGFDLVVDAVGSGKVLGEGHAALAVCGTIMTVGGGADTPAIQITQHLIKGATYRGTHQGDSVSRVFIPYLISLWRQGKFPFDKMLTSYKFSELDQAIKDTKSGKCIKHKLGPEERLMGDLYVKSEFRAHRSVENPMHIIGFLTEWQLYAQQLEGDSWKGEHLDKHKMDKMSDEQVAQLYELMQTIKRKAEEDAESNGQQ